MPIGLRLPSSARCLTGIESVQKVIRCAKCHKAFEVVGNQGSQSQMRAESVSCPYDCGESTEVMWPKNQPFFVRAAESSRIDWKRICKLNPLVLSLYLQAKAVRDNKRKRRFCANNSWDQNFKPFLVHQVGWMSNIPELKTQQAYRLACDKIYSALPDCRNCFCVGVGNF